MLNTCHFEVPPLNFQVITFALNCMKTFNKACRVATIPHLCSVIHLVETWTDFRTEVFGSCQIHLFVSKACTMLLGRHVYISSTYGTDSWCDVLPTVFHKRPRSISNHVLYIIIMTICTFGK